MISSTLWSVCLHQNLSADDILRFGRELKWGDGYEVFERMLVGQLQQATRFRHKYRYQSEKLK